MKYLKLKIKELSATQRELRNQRKTVHIVGDRTMAPKQAAYSHAYYRDELRIMFAAYGLLRGKPFSVTESHYPEKDHPLNAFKVRIDSIVSNAEVIRASE